MNYIKYISKAILAIILWLIIWLFCIYSLPIAIPFLWLGILDKHEYKDWITGKILKDTLRMIRREYK